MILQTQIPLRKETENLIDYRSEVLLLGSCFVENIGKKLAYYKFQNNQNPFGVLFHPKAIETLVVNAVQENIYTKEDIFFHNEQWHCFDAHSHMSDCSQDALLDHLNAQVQATRAQLEKASHVVITLGTAWVYKHYKSNLLVANCHKVAQKEFSKTLLSIEEVTEALQNLIDKIKTVNTKATVIFTVSPVRHTKDGFVENTRSKAHLIAAIHDVLLNEGACNGFYFPSYEIMMDELRDYRFYAEDMIHPNDTAINYIWEKFQEVWMSKDAVETMAQVNDVQKAMAHRSFSPKSEAHINFLKQLELKKEKLQEKFNHMIF